MLEAEDATGGTDGPSPPYSTASNDNYNAVIVNSTSETVLLTWTLPQATLEAMRGNYAAFLLRFYSDPTADLKLRLKIQEPTTGALLWQGEQVLTTTEQILELGHGRVPPQIIGETDLSPLELVLTGQRSAAGTSTLNVDWLQITPLDSDGMRYFEPRAGVYLQYQQKLIDDQINGSLYVLTSGGLKLPRYTVFGRPMLLWPGQAQRLYFVCQNSAGDGQIARTSKIKIFVRPRKLAL
jgi:hypothetical protein